MQLAQYPPNPQQIQMVAVQQSKAAYPQSNLSAQQLQPKKIAPIDIVFHNLVYTVTVADQKSKLCNRLPKIRKEILKGVTGIIRHGRVTAIMGASGAGKTSLLNILACRIQKARNIEISGSVMVNMKQYNYNQFGDFANYVMQNDILMQTMTVRQTLEFAGSMTLDLPKEQRETIVEKLIKDLKLEKCADVLVGGNDIKGISGGEKKRTSIAFELISDPQVVFLDEPTSGLDSLTAYVIVWYTKKLASAKNKTVAMTIHQPSSEIFDLFDDLILMVAGRLVYQGPAADSVPHFAQMGFRTPEFSNPPDYFMSIMHHESKKNVANYPRYFQAYDQQIAPRINQAIQASERGPWEKRVITTSFCRGLGTLMWRDAVNIQRNPVLLTSRIVQTIILSLITGALFWKLSRDYSNSGLSKSFNSKNGALFFLSISNFMSSMSPVILTFPLEKSVFLKEQGNKMYSVFSYFLSRNLVELPLLIIGPLLNALIVYWMIDLHPGGSYWWLFFLVSFLCSLAGNSFGLLCSSFFSDAKVASGMLPMVVLPLMLFSGFYKNRKDLPGWIGWIEYISPIKYTFVGYARNQYRNTSAPIELLNFDVSLGLAIILLIVLAVVSRILALIVLSCLKSRLQ